MPHSGLCFINACQLLFVGSSCEAMWHSLQAANGSLEE